MPYIVRFTDEINKGSLIVEDRDINTDTSLQFPGKQSTGYGQSIAENFLHLLENFAANFPPSNPVEGQTWYDNTVGVDQLKVYDGTNWVAAGGLKRGAATPDIANSTKGDLWVDTDNQQLYLNNGASWILVGPEFSQGLATGARAEQILGTDDELYTILKIDIDNQPAVILTAIGFTPKATIRGFTSLSPGFNLSSINFSNGTLKYNGTAQAAEGLIVSGSATPVSASNFLRADVISTANAQLRVKTNDGIQVGINGQLSLQASGSSGVINSYFSGACLDLNVKTDLGQDATVIRIKSDTNVGINKENPQESLDVNGVIQTNERVIILGTEDSDLTFDDTLTDGSFVTSGGVSIAKHLKVASGVIIKGDLNIDGNITTNPEALTTPNISGFNTITATTFVGNLQGSVTGTIEGSASSASKLTSKTTFKMSGDVSAPDILFDGTGNLVKTFTTTLSNEFIGNKASVNEPQNGDEILINRTVGETGLYRITQANLLKTVPKNPVGMVVPFAGSNTPDGWIICDGRIVTKASAFDLWLAIGHQFLDPSLIPAALAGASSATHFALPDFRGRFLLGADNMGGLPANRVTASAAAIVGNAGGTEAKDIRRSNLPAHEHDLYSSSGQQFYAINDTPDNDAFGPEVIGLDIPTGASTTSGLPTAGKIKNGGVQGNDDYRTVSGEQLGSAIDIMPPFQTINFIIFADNA